MTDRATFVLNETIDLPAEALTLRVGVTSTALARTGTAHLRVDVPDIRGSRLVMTPLVLGTSSPDSDAVLARGPVAVLRITAREDVVVARDARQAIT